MKNKYAILLQNYILLMKSKPNQGALEKFFAENENVIDSFMRDNYKGSISLVRRFWRRISPKKWFKRNHEINKKSWLASFLIDHYAGTEVHERGHQVASDELIGESGLVVNYESETFTPGSELYDFTSGIVRGEQVNLESISSLLFPIGGYYRGATPVDYGYSTTNTRNTHNQRMRENFDESRLESDERGYLHIKGEYSGSEIPLVDQIISDTNESMYSEAAMQSATIHEREKWVALAGPLASLLYVMVLWTMGNKIKRHEATLKRAALFQHVRMFLYSFTSLDPKSIGDFKYISEAFGTQLQINPIAAAGAMVGFYAITFGALFKSFTKISAKGKLVESEKEAWNIFGMPKDVVDWLDAQFTDELFKEIMEERIELSKIAKQKIYENYGHFTAIYQFLIADIIAKKLDKNRIKGSSLALLQLIRQARNEIRKSFFRKKQITVEGEALLPVKNVRNFLKIPIFPRYKNVEDMIKATITERYKETEEDDLYLILHKDEYRITRLLFLMARSLPRTKKIVRDINTILHEENGYISAETFFYISSIEFYLRKKAESVEEVGKRSDLLKGQFKKK